jgi:chromosome segregation ATPase
MAAKFGICVCLLFGLSMLVDAGKVTPMEKVIGLLKDLSAKVAAEGKKEAAQYDKFACFCKEQADEKLYAIEKSTAKIADLKAEIKELDGEIAELNSQISDLSKTISRLEDEIDKKTKKREKQHAEYEVKAQDMSEAIAACSAAIEALKDSKSAMSGAKLNLVQKTGGAIKVWAKSENAVALLSKLKTKAAPKFQYQGNEIIATLQDLLAEFKQMKKDLDIEEFDINSAFEKNRLSLSNEKKFAEKDKAEKEEIVESKTEQLEAAKSDRDEEQADMDADQQFMDVLTKDCEEKATLFDQRSSLRADELKTLSEATAKLQEGAVPNFSANKKLVGLQKAATAPSSSVSFVQIKSVQHQQSGKEGSLQKVRSFLGDVAERTGSRALSALAVRVSLAEDHFVKVRSLIKDLIAKLKADAKAEAEQKGICDTGMAKAINKRDEANAKIEVANGKITTLTANKNALEDEIADLNGKIAELKKALLEATELRADDKAENEKTIEMSDEGAEAVKLALGLLQDFYKNAFVQTGKYVPPNSDRDGNTVGDLAPEVFDSKYHGAQAESKGIVGILEVILSDFERSNSQAKSDEKESEEAFETFEKDTNDDIGKKEKRIKNAEGELSDTEASILDQQQALKDAKELLDDGLQALEELEGMCVKGEETWEERKQKREDEINALKEALAILEDAGADFK